MDPSDVHVRVRREFADMPGLRLTMRQAQRLFGLDDALCGQVIDALVNAAFLRRRGDVVCRPDVP